jgi:hypothetical protein
MSFSASSRPGSRAGSRPGSGARGRDAPADPAVGRSQRPDLPPPRASSRPGSSRGATAGAREASRGDSAAPRRGARAAADPERADASAAPSGGSAASSDAEDDDPADVTSRLTSEELEAQIAHLRERIAESDARDRERETSAGVNRARASNPPADPSASSRPGSGSPPARDAASSSPRADDLASGDLDDRRLARAPDDTLDALIERLARSSATSTSLSTQRAMLEIEEREAARARMRTDLAMYLAGVRRNADVDWSGARFDDAKRDALLAAKMRRELRKTGKITLSSARVEREEFAAEGNDADSGAARAKATDGGGEDDDAPSGETERAIAAGLAKIARLDAKLSALAGEDAGEGDEGGGQKDATSAREARVAERRRERRLEKMANLRRALRAPALEDAANALGAFSADGSRRFSRLSPEEDALAERLLAAFEDESEEADEEFGEAAAAEASSSRASDYFAPPPSVVSGRAESECVSDAGGGESGESISSRLAAIDAALRRLTSDAFEGSRGVPSLSRSAEPSEPSSAAYYEKDRRSGGLEALESRSATASLAALERAEMEIDRRLVELKLSDDRSRRADRRAIEAVLAECREREEATGGLPEKENRRV